MAIVLQFLNKLWFQISKGSAATCLLNYYDGFVAFTHFSAGKEFWRSVNMWKGYSQKRCYSFYVHGVVDEVPNEKYVTVGHTGSGAENFKTPLISPEWGESQDLLLTFGTA